MTYAEPERRREMVNGLRELAGLLESCPDIPAPCTLDVLVFPPRGSDTGICAEIDRIAAILGVTVDDDTARYGHYTASKRFGPVAYQAVAIPSRTRAWYDARNSYAGNVTTAMDEEG
jgi:hypothetical protein